MIEDITKQFLMEVMSCPCLFFGHEFIDGEANNGNPLISKQPEMEEYPWNLNKHSEHILNMLSSLCNNSNLTDNCNY